jgi:ribonuclease HII
MFFRRGEEDVPPQQTLRDRSPRRLARGALGLDEAGRGSVLGPLVVGAYWTGASVEGEESALRAMGVKDSKLLAPGVREALYAQLRARGKVLAFRAEPALIDRHVERQGLNDLELEMMARLTARLSPSVVYVDACDPDAERFGRNLGALARTRGWHGRVVARHHADRDLPIVGAASIVAKVTRDRAISRLQERSVRLLGTGYPADPRTREYLDRLLREGATLPPWVRRSWSTLDTLKSGPPLRTLETYG